MRNDKHYLIWVQLNHGIYIGIQKGLLFCMRDLFIILMRLGICPTKGEGAIRGVILIIGTQLIDGLNIRVIHIDFGGTGQLDLWELLELMDHMLDSLRRIKIIVVEGNNNFAGGFTIETIPLCTDILLLILVNIAELRDGFGNSRKKIAHGIGAIIENNPLNVL